MALSSKSSAGSSPGPGSEGVSALCARRRIAAKLATRGRDVDQIGAVLGLTERNSVRNLIHNEHESRQALVRELV